MATPRPAPAPDPVTARQNRVMAGGDPAIDALVASVRDARTLGAARLAADAALRAAAVRAAHAAVGDAAKLADEFAGRVDALCVGYIPHKPVVAALRAFADAVRKGNER